MEVVDVEKQMEEWEEHSTEKRGTLKGDVKISSDAPRAAAYLSASFPEPKKRESKRTKESEVDLKKSKRGKNKNELF